MKRNTKRSLLWLLVVILASSTVLMAGISAAEPASSDPSEDVAAAEETTQETEAAAETQETAPPAEEAASELKPIAENEHLILYFDEMTTEIAVENKKTKAVWRSNPEHRASDPIASAFNKGRLGAALSIVYYNAAGHSIEFNSFHDSVERNQFEFELIENGVKINYVLGDNSVGIDAIPKRISIERMEEKILSKVADEAVKKDFLKRFKLIEEEGVYERRDGINDIQIRRIVQLFDEVGYTPEDVAQDNVENGTGEGTVDEKVKFTVPLQYELDGDDLLVTVHSNEIVQPDKYPLHAIRLLEYFGAADTSKSGYIFVPDGSGSLINLNNGKAKYDPYSAPVYGYDSSIFRQYSYQVDETVRMPVYGLRQDDDAFFAIIENGDAVANIEADVSGRINSYNQVFSSYTITTKEDITLTGGYRSNTIPIFQARSLQSDIVVRYAFLHGESASYSGMASYYQDYLVNKYGLKQLAEAGDLPFYLDLVGTITRRTSFLGIPYKSLEPMTTFEQAESIIDELKAGGIGPINLRYLGWFNKGVSHTVPTSVHVDSKLGGKKGLKQFVDNLAKNNVSLFPDVAFMNLHRDSISFLASRDASRFVNRKPVKLASLNLATRDMEKLIKQYYAVSPKKLPDYVASFIKDYQKLGIGGLSLRDLGDALHSDYKVSNVIDRQQAADIVREQTSKISGDINNLLVVGGNATALPYAKHVVELPLTGSRFNITDQSIPFMPMVLHGYIEYAGVPVNLADNQDPTLNMLQIMESGSNVYYRWSHSSSSDVKETEFDYLYATQYEAWIGDAKSIYAQVNEALKDVRNARIVDHERVADNVYQTTYENGKRVVVNYNDNMVEVDGIKIERESFWVGGDGR